jgi:hypothetical protein
MQMAELKLSSYPNCIKYHELDIVVSLDVQNVSKTDGVEVVQLYVRDLVSSVTTPVMALKGFSRIYLAAGEKNAPSYPDAVHRASRPNGNDAGCLPPH